MSLCIAAACHVNGKGHVVLSHDWKITEGDASSENTDKQGFVKRGWPALYAGITPDMDLIGDVFWDHLRSIAITEDNIEPELQAARAKFKAALIDRDLRGRIGMGYEEFMSRGKKAFRADEHRQMFDQMQRELSQCEMLVAGVIDGDAYLFHVAESFAVPLDHFGTIGEGEAVASRWLHWRNQNDRLSLEQTVLNVFEAQRFGSMTNTVGRQLSVYVLDHHGVVRQIHPLFKNKLERHYQSIKQQKGLPLTEQSFRKPPVEVVD